MGKQSWWAIESSTPLDTLHASLGFEGVARSASRLQFGRWPPVLMLIFLVTRPSPCVNLRDIAPDVYA